MKLKPLRLAAACAAVLAAGAASAHHGFGNFDRSREIALEGTITKIDFVNPHAYVYFEVANADGTKTEWQCEMRAATVLRRSGWSETMFAPGSSVSITGSPDRNAPNTCYLGTITFADGTSMDRYGQRQRPAVAVASDRPERTPSGVINLGGDWAGEQRVMTDRRGISGALVPISVADRLAPGAVPEGGRAFPGARGTPESLADNAIEAAWARQSPLALTDAGRAAAEGFDPSSTDNPRLRCEPTNILFDWGFETFTNRITQDENTIRIQYGAPGIDRTIHLNMTAHPANIEPSVAGHSIGRFEGDVLVVDTVGFKPGVLSADARLMHSSGLHVVERFSIERSNGAPMLRREYVAEDPQYFAGQFRGTDTAFIADLPYEAPTCNDLSYKTGVGTVAIVEGQSGAPSSSPAAAPAEPAKPWWMFWK